RRGPAVAPAGAARAIRGFRGLAELLAVRRGAGERDLLLAPEPHGPAAAPRTAHRPAAARGAELPRCLLPGAPVGGAHPAGTGSRPARGGDALHGAPRRLPGSSGAL